MTEKVLVEQAILPGLLKSQMGNIRPLILILRDKELEIRNLIVLRKPLIT